MKNDGYKTRLLNATQLAEATRPYLEKFQAGMKDENDEYLAPHYIYTMLVASPNWAGIRRVMAYRFGKTSGNIPASIEEQMDAQTMDLYTRAIGGDVQAKKLWFERVEKDEDVQTFNVSVKVTPKRVADPSLKAIASEADIPFVIDILKGLDDRLEMDEAPHELRDKLKEFAEGFDEWGAVAYAPKDI